MNSKSLVRADILVLLNSAIQRDTSQGRLVCSTSLQRLGLAESETDILRVLEDLNHAFAGIEAHGSLSTDEFKAVVRLRELQRSLQMAGA